MDSSNSVSKQQVQQLREHGWVVVRGILSNDEIGVALEAVYRHFPSAEEYAARPGRFRWLQGDEWAGLVLFPFPERVLNLLVVHPRIIDFAELFLGTKEIQLIRASFWAKYAAAAEYEQVMHFDYPNHTLVVPRQEPGYSQVEGFLFLSDVTEDLGPTLIVPRDKAQNMGFVPTHPTREQFPELYEAEVAATGSAGSLFAFTPDIYHRASAITASRGHRLTVGFSYSVGGRPWLGYTSWPRLGEEPMLVDFLAHATPRQREMLGFPSPEDAYWSEFTLEGVAARYSGMDMEPYRKALR